MISEEIKKIQKRSKKVKKNFKNRCFLVIETLVGGDIIYNDVEKLKSDIYKIAHIGIQTCEHKDWADDMERLFKHFEKSGLI